MKVQVIFVVILAVLAVIYGFTDNEVSTDVESTDFSNPLDAEQNTTNPFNNAEADAQQPILSDMVLKANRMHVGHPQNTLEESYDAFALSPEAETVQHTDDVEMVVSESLAEAPEGDFGGYSSTVDAPIDSESKVETNDMDSKQL